MKNTLKLDHANRTIIMDRTFAKFAANTMSTEYAHLQAVRQDYPEYAVVLRKIKRNKTKECYAVDLPTAVRVALSSEDHEKRRRIYRQSS